MTEDRSPITVAWLWEICPEGWTRHLRGISLADWSINSVVPVVLFFTSVKGRNEATAYDAGPFVWNVVPSHGPNMDTLVNPCDTHYTILVLEDREDVLLLLKLLTRKGGNRG